MCLYHIITLSIVSLFPALLFYYFWSFSFCLNNVRMFFGFRNMLDRFFLHYFSFGLSESIAIAFILNNFCLLIILLWCYFLSWIKLIFPWPFFFFCKTLHCVLLMFFFVCLFVYPLFLWHSLIDIALTPPIVMFF